MASSSSSSTLPPPPPPTPSNHHSSTTTTTTTTTTDAVALSHFLRQLTPTLSLPPSPLHRHHQIPTPNTISLLHPQPSLLLDSTSNHGFFHLTDHGIATQGFTLACDEFKGLVEEPCGSNHLVLGFDEEDGGGDGFFVFDVGCVDSLSVPMALGEIGVEMGKVGVEVVDMLLSASGLEKTFQKEGTRGLRCLMWVSSSPTAAKARGDCSSWERRYPYVLCLHYGMRSCTRFKLLLGDDLAEVTVPTLLDSILVTVGDIAQVWSNGRFKKVIGRAMPSFSDEDKSSCVMLSLLVTLPIDSIVSPLPPIRLICDDDGGDNDEEELENKYWSFPLEEYAWRVYHENLTFKDPLLRYRV